MENRQVLPELLAGEGVEVEWLPHGYSHLHQTVSSLRVLAGMYMREMVNEKFHPIHVRCKNVDCARRGPIPRLPSTST